MELIYKSVAAAITTAIIVILIKRHNPELSTVLSICAVTVILFSAIGFAGEIKELISSAVRFSNTSEIYITAILKCLAVSIITKLGAEICKDANQAALAATVEFTGTICALNVTLPLVMSMLELVRKMV